MMHPPPTSTLTLIIAEAALETIPNEIAGHAAVRNHSQRMQMKSSEILLDRSYHHAAMKRLANSLKRGRPDIIHFSLMEALATPLFMEMKLKVYVHTINDKIITIADNLRIPKSYFRFERLMANLFRDKIIKSNEGSVLLEMSDGTFSDLVNSIKPNMIIGLSTVGVQSNAQRVAENAQSLDHSCVVVGGFAKGHFSENVTRSLGPTYSISSIGLEAHVVIARVLYEYEKLLEKGINYKGNE
ncbi:MAG: ribosome biogenesis protein [Thermoproteota archaeon]|nr:ribosome biogenesis protein [Thermoproteota archaeon]